jgi:membrane-bound ClpP family serine protease
VRYLFKLYIYSINRIIGRYRNDGLIPSGALIKYILLQIPVLCLLIISLIIINRIKEIPLWASAIIIILWIIKDIALFPKVWRAYDSKNTDHRKRIIGKKGIAIDDLDPSGYIKIMGELWKAEVIDNRLPVRKGETVKVNEISSMKLIVERADEH